MVRRPMVRKRMFASQNLRRAGFLGIERKFYDTQHVGAVIIAASTTGGNGEYDPPTLLTLSAPAQGNGPSDREGSVITLDSVIVTGLIKCTVTLAQAVLPTVFIALVLDRQTNGAQLASETVFEVNNGPELAVCPLVNMEYVHRYKILKTVRVHPWEFGNIVAGTAPPEGAVPFRLYAKLGGLQARFANAAAGIASCVDNSLHVIAFASSQTATQPEITYQARIRFRG